MDGLTDGPARLLEVLQGVAGHDLVPPEGVNRRIADRPLVKRRDAPSDLLDVLVFDLAAQEALFERRVLRQALHLDRPIDRLADRFHSGRRHRHHPEVDLRRQTPIEAHFLLAEMLAFLGRGEIDEAEAHGFLDLVGETVGQEDDRDVRLTNADLSRRRGVRLRARQQTDQGIEVHGCPGSDGTGGFRWMALTSGAACQCWACSSSSPAGTVTAAVLS